MLLTHLSPLNINMLSVSAAGQKSSMQKSRLAVTMLWAAVALLAGALAGVLVFIYGHKVGSRGGQLACACRTCLIAGPVQGEAHRGPSAGCHSVSVKLHLWQPVCDCPCETWAPLQAAACPLCLKLLTERFHLQSDLQDVRLPSDGSTLTAAHFDGPCSLCAPCALSAHTGADL